MVSLARGSVSYGQRKISLDVQNGRRGRAQKMGGRGENNTEGVRGEKREANTVTTKRRQTIKRGKRERRNREEPII